MQWNNAIIAPKAAILPIYLHEYQMFTMRQEAGHSGGHRLVAIVSFRTISIQLTCFKVTAICILYRVITVWAIFR